MKPTKKMVPPDTSLAHQNLSACQKVGSWGTVLMGTCSWAGSWMRRLQAAASTFSGLKSTEVADRCHRGIMVHSYVSEMNFSVSK